MEGTALVLSISALLAGGWTAAFSKAGKDVSGLSGSMRELNAMGGKSFSLVGMNAAQSALDEARERLETFQKKLGDKKPTAEQERELNRLKKSVEDAGTTFDKAKDKVSDWKKSLHKNFVDVDRALTLVKRNDALEELGRKLSEVKTRAGAAWGTLRAFGLSLFAQASAVVAATASVSDWGDTMAKAAQRLNMFDAAGTENVEQLQRMQWAALQANIEGETFVKYLDDMTRRLAQAAEGSGEAANAYARLGLSAKALSQMGADRQFELIIEAFGKIESSTERVRLAGQIWGEEAARSMPNLIARGMTQIRADMDAATEHIVTGNRRVVDSCGAWDTAMKELRGTWNSVFRGAVISVMPTVTDAMKKLSAVIADNRERFNQLVGNISGIAIPAVSFLASHINALIGVVGIFAGALTAVKAFQFGKDLFATGAAAVSAGKALAAYASTLNLSAIAQKTAAAAAGVWKGITTAATAAQWALNAAMTANPIGLVVAGIVAAVAAVAAAGYAIYKNWEPIKEFFTGLFAKLKNGFTAVAGWVKQGFTAAWEWLKNSAVFKAVSWVAETLFGAGGSLSAAGAAAVPAAAPNPLPAGTLESLSRASVVNSRSAADNRTFTTNANIAISQQPGEDAEALAERVSARLAENYSSALAAAI